MQQTALFNELMPSPGALPDGLIYRREFLSRTEEASLVELIQRLPLQEAKYKSYTARRRVLSYGGKFDYDTNELLPTGQLVEELHPLRDRVARWAGMHGAEAAAVTKGATGLQAVIKVLQQCSATWSASVQQKLCCLGVVLLKCE